MYIIHKLVHHGQEIVVTRLYLVRGRRLIYLLSVELGARLLHLQLRGKKIHTDNNSASAITRLRVYVKVLDYRHHIRPIYESK